MTTWKCVRGGLMMLMAGLMVWSAQAQIKPGDSIQLYLRGVPADEQAKVDGRYVVGESGVIRLPIADVPVMAAGLNGEQLARKIEAAYRTAEIYQKPTIVVVMSDTPDGAPAQVSVGGQVKRPGPLRFRPGMTALQAVQGAGDMTPFGTRKRVFLKRDGETLTLDFRRPEGESFKLESADVLVVDRKGVWDRE